MCEDNNLPTELENYIEKETNISYTVRNKLKAGCQSARFDRTREKWIVSTEDYNKYYNN